MVKTKKVFEPKSDRKDEEDSKLEFKAIDYDVTKTIVVKRCLMNSINLNIPEDRVNRFLKLIDQYTEMVSRMSRRASIMLLYYVMRCHELNLTIPEYDKKGFPDAYFKQLLRIGLDEFEGDNVVKVPSKCLFDVPEGGKIRDEGMAACFEEIKDLLGTTLGPNGKCMKVPVFFDSVLGHAAIAFKTMFLNNLKVPFISKMARLCKFMSTGVPNTNGHKVLHALRNNSALPEWPLKLKQFIDDARSILGLGPMGVLYDDTPLSSLVRMRFAWWQQQIFAEGDQRRNMMSPVFKVSRMHVRLDATTLYKIAWTVLFDPPKQDLKCPTKETHPDPAALKIAKVEWKAVSESDKEKQKLYNTEMADVLNKNPRYGQLKNPVNPKTVLDKQYKMPSVQKKKEKPENISVEEWDARVKEQTEEREEMRALKKSIKDSEKYKAEEAIYNAYEKGVHDFAMLLFKPFQDKSLKSGWVRAASVVTDGVSLCVMYEKTVTLTTTCPAKIKKTKYLDELEPKNDYDPYATTMVGDTLVLGVDPGRTQIVTVMCIDANGKKHAWRLSRGQYYTDGCILSENKRQTKRYENMQPHFARILLEGGSLRTDKSDDVKQYLAWYKTVESQWWGVALSRAESRGKIQRYIGKKKVMSKFFNKLKKEATLLLTDGQRIDVAYGSAVMSMPSTGRGEVAAPVGAAYRACKEAFGPKNVSEEWEFKTTQVDWYTQKQKELVYKRFDPVTGRERLHHTHEKRPHTPMA